MKCTRLLGVAAFCVVLAGCDELGFGGELPGGYCAEDSECASDDCLNGLCQGDCESDEDCAEGAYCEALEYTSRSTCVRPCSAGCPKEMSCCQAAGVCC